MSGKFDDPQHWLNLAIETRGLAASMSDVFSIRQMMLIAQRYELMTERASRRAQQNPEAESA